MSVRFQINPTHLEKPYFLRPKNKRFPILNNIFSTFFSILQLFQEMKQSKAYEKNVSLIWLSLPF